MNNLSLDFITSGILNISMQFMIVFVPLFIGIYIKENHEASKKKVRRKIHMAKAIGTTSTLSIVLMSTVPYGINKVGLPVFFSITFLIGVSSKKFIEMIFDGSLLNIIFKFLGKSKGSLQESIQEVTKETENENSE